MCLHSKIRAAAGLMQPPSEKMSGIVALSTQLKPQTDGAGERCSTTPSETMVTVRQQEASQANRRLEDNSI